MWNNAGAPPDRCLAWGVMDDQLSLLNQPPDPEAERRLSQREAERQTPPLVRTVRAVIADELARVVAERAEDEDPPGA